ncbi:hypothetical protein [Roseomonas indoligenes]|nr:hypothetical protein [Pararoseomonas indoligenes]
MPSLTSEQIVAIDSMFFAGLAGLAALLPTFGALRFWRDTLDR